MKVVTDAGETIELGAVETAPTIGIIDYSRRVTDDFGVTTVVERGFARRMSVKLALATDTADVLQRRLADLRATPALWVADDRFDSLTVRGFYKDFSLDLAIPALSYCTLTVEGLAATGAFADPGGDPAPEGQPSTLQLLAPVAINDAGLKASSVAEADAPEWSASAAYPSGVRVMKAATHRVYESVAAVNAGDDPVAASGRWLDVGPTNRWAMFDQALGSITTADKSIAVTLDAGVAGAVALLDVIAATVRIQATGYDRTVAAGAGAITFLDLPAGAGQVTVTIAGPGTVSVGTLLIGRLVALGITEASPTAGITDYSRKVVDDFGAISIVQRAWAKRMTANALIRTDAIDLVAGRIAAVRALPALWIGQAGLDSLTVYGFFKDFSIEVGETVSKLSLSIEGLSAAAKIEPLKTGIDWPDVGDPLGTKPADNADVTGDNTSKDTHAVAGTPAESIVQQMGLNGFNALYASAFATNKGAELDALKSLQDGSALTVKIADLTAKIEDPTQNGIQTVNLIGAAQPDGNGGTIFVIGQNTAYGSAGKLLGQTIDTIVSQVGGHEASITSIKEIISTPNGSSELRALTTLNADGVITGTINTLTGGRSKYAVLADEFRIVSTDAGGVAYTPFSVIDGVVTMLDVEITKLRAGSVTITSLAPGLSNVNRYTQGDTAIPAGEVTLCETPFFDVGDGASNGSALVTISFEHDGLQVRDSAASLRIYVDDGTTGGYVQRGATRRSGIIVTGGSGFWVISFSAQVPISALGKVRVKLTGQGLSIQGGPAAGTVARGTTIDVMRIGR